MTKKNKFLLMLAGVNIEVTTFYPYTRKLCEEYIVSDIFEKKNADYQIEITEEDIALEREKSEAEYSKASSSIKEFKDDYLESLAVYRKIAELLVNKNIFLFHGSCVAVDGTAYVFTAKSGTGKSTHTRLWREVFGERALMVNDDKPLISLTKEGAIIYGTPWDGKHKISTNISLPLKAICILKRAEGKENRIKELTKREAQPMILQQTYRPRDTEGLIKTLELVNKLGDCVKFYELYCNIDTNAVYMAYERMV